MRGLRRGMKAGGARGLGADEGQRQKEGQTGCGTLKGAGWGQGQRRVLGSRGAERRHSGEGTRRSPHAEGAWAGGRGADASGYRDGDRRAQRGQARRGWETRSGGGGAHRASGAVGTRRGRHRSGWGFGGGSQAGEGDEGQGPPGREL